jgi:hypothetical protein
MSARASVMRIEDVETGVASGSFHARVPLSPARVPELSRSWEAFDRAFERLGAEAEHALLARYLWPLLSEDGASDLSEPAGLGVAFTLPGDHLCIWPVDLWRTKLAEWRAAKSSSSDGR